MTHHWRASTDSRKHAFVPQGHGYIALCGRDYRVMLRPLARDRSPKVPEGACETCKAVAMGWEVRAAA